MKIPTEFQITELQDPAPEPEPTTGAPPTPGASPEKMRDGLQKLIGNLIGERRALRDQLNEDREQQNRETRAFYLKLLGICDSLDRMIRNADPENEMVNGLNVLRTELFLVLEDQEILPIELTIGQAFDKETCEGVSRKLRPDLPEYSIISIDRRGYTWKSKTLRRARVVISVQPKGE